MSLIRPSGGLYWHWRAMNNRAHWLPFSREIGQWLEGWHPPCKHLLLIGPSGGWSMSAEWLARFEQVTLLDPDPAARWIFGFRFRNILKNQIVKWHRVRFEDWLPSAKALSGNPAVLFSNVLGQIRYERHDYAQVLSRIPSMLTGCHWASYHDCLSSESQPYREDLVAFNAVTRMDESSLSQRRLGGVWTDHGTMDLFELSHSVRYIPWWFSSSRLHWVQAGIVNPKP